MKDNPKYAYACGWNRYNMGMIGVWPETNEMILLRYRAWVITLLISLFIWAPELASVTVFWTDINATIECLSVNVPVAVSIMKLVVFRSRRKVLRDLLKLVEEDWALPWTKDEEAIMMALTKISRVISMISVYVGTGLLIAYVVSVLLGVQKWNDPDLDPRLATGFLYPSIFPYNTDNKYNFISTWIAQLIGTWLSLIAYSGPDAFVAMLVLHLCGQLAVVRLNIKNIVNEDSLKDPRIFHQKLGAIVKRHEELNRRARMIEDAFNTMLLAQVVVSTIILCFQGFATLTTPLNEGGDVSYLTMTFFILHSIFFGIYSIMHLFVYCWVGDLLMTESSDIGYSPYESEWYLMSPNEAKALMLVTHRSRTPLQITAGKFVSFSLEMFTSIMKTSMGYLSVLLVMKDRLLE